MSRTISERDWKVFKELHPITLGRLCEKVLGEAKAEVERTEKTPHARYLSLVKLINKREKDVVRCFDDLRRSSAFIHLDAIHRLGLFTEAEMLDFSLELQEQLKSLL